jgi:hypothetical protein
MTLVSGHCAKTSLEALLEALRGGDARHALLKKIAKAAADFRPRFAIGAKV